MFPYYLVLPAVSCLVCIVAGLLFWKYIPVSFRLLIVEGLLSMAGDIVGYYFGRLTGHQVHNNHAFFNVLLLVIFSLLLLATYSVLPLRFKRIFYPLASCVFIAAWFFFVQKQSMNSFANWTFIISSFILAVNYLTVVFYNERHVSREQLLPLRLICFSIVMYHCCTVPVFSLMKYLTSPQKHLPVWIYDISMVFDCLKYLLIATGFTAFKRSNGQLLLKTTVSE